MGHYHLNQKLYFVVIVVTVVGEKEQDIVYEVLFDEEFLGGLTIRFVADELASICSNPYKCACSAL